MITLRLIERIANQIIKESTEGKLNNRIADQELATMIAFKSKLIMKIYDEIHEGRNTGQRSKMIVAGRLSTDEERHTL